MLNLDLKSVVALTQLAVPHLEKVNGVIVNISSILGQRPVIECSLFVANFLIIAIYSESTLYAVLCGQGNLSNLKH